MVDKYVCPVCLKAQWTYRTATAEDQRQSLANPLIEFTECTGPLHFVEHGNEHVATQIDVVGSCEGSHRPVSQP